MSSKATAWAWRKDVRLTTQHILVAMADVADDDGYLFPSYEYLAYKTRASQRTVVTAIKELVELGLVLCERNHHSDGARAANLFFLMLDNRDHDLPAWRGPVSTKERKVQFEHFRKEAMPPPSREVPQETSSAGSALRPEAGDGNHPGKPVVQDLHLGDSAQLGPVEVPQETSSAGSAPRPEAGDETGGKPVVQDLHLGATKVQKTSNLSANFVNAPLKEPHDDLSHHHQSARENAGRGPAEAGTMIDDDPSEHRGVDLAGLKHRLEPVLGPCTVPKLVWVIDQALSRATVRVSNPTAFVLKCVANDPERFTALSPSVPGPTALGQGGVPAAGAGTRSRGLLGPGERACPKPDHGQYAADHCPACRVESLIADEETSPAEMTPDQVARWRAERATQRAAERGTPRVSHRPSAVSGGRRS